MGYGWKVCGRPTIQNAHRGPVGMPEQAELRCQVLCQAAGVFGNGGEATQAVNEGKAVERCGDGGVGERAVLKPAVTKPPALAKGKQTREEKSYGCVNPETTSGLKKQGREVSTGLWYQDAVAQLPDAGPQPSGECSPIIAVYDSACLTREEQRGQHHRFRITGH